MREAVAPSFPIFRMNGEDKPLMRRLAGDAMFEGRDALDPDTGGSSTDVGQDWLGVGDGTSGVAAIFTT